ncbi:HAD family hydrolase [Brooklawnia cerclae]|uniref:HAD family hydrolase n=1 Tax=Brooklawnia cerclae TaxID=349934 RepID=UPI001ABB74A1|nr:HAD family hydrolase [Brooklawnia cerclae]
MVAVDIDGTLVDREGQMPSNVKAAVQRVAGSGTPLVLATGRAWLDARPVFDELVLPPSHVVCSNGAVWLEYPPIVERRQRTFDPGPVIREVATLAPHARIAVEDLGRGFRLNRLFPDGDLTGAMTLEPLEELASRPVTRVIVRDPEADDQEFIDLAAKLGMHGVSYSVGWSAWLDIAPEGVNKASALATISNELGIDRRDVLAIGDGRNDIEMLAWAGRGVAMGDAPDEVKAAADEVTADFADGGAALELDRWFAFAPDARERVLRTA